MSELELLEEGEVGEVLLCLGASSSMRTAVSH